MSGDVIEHGMVHVYTGDGKGKTTAALGLALRALGWGARVCVVQFIKGYPDIGEAHFAAEFGGNFTLRQFARDDTRSITEADVGQRRAQAQEALEFAQAVLARGDCDVLILDEINNALHHKLVDVERVLSLMKDKPEHLELVLTGRNAPRKIIEAADYVTEMNMVKHPYQRGIGARKGIDY